MQQVVRELPLYTFQPVHTGTRHRLYELLTPTGEQYGRCCSITEARERTQKKNAMWWMMNMSC